ncbi:hypothetical protein D8674_005440 [Pyrus ussuriensis x Pyrus communis]|uniref:Reverse transcriptase Ty1/copia-type domain-containing protein n=1 Tax=Pyrus ussuriensis x Pyrus communis TaxID=2448454 RepID=A0A5N5FRU6_9ROSA|nr:hypothetical protein D8674_005440 [Pyrus ussuriensis x Pyrus communis]
MWIESSKLIPFVSNTWAVLYFLGDPMSSLAAKLRVLKGKLRVWNSSSFGDVNSVVDSSLHDLNVIREEIASLGLSDERSAKKRNPKGMYIRLLAHEAWSIFQDIFTAVSKSIINMLKIEFQTLQKGTDSIDKFLSRLKFIRDQLIAAGEVVSDNDMIIAALAGLPREYAIIWTVILARETYISLKEFRVRLLNTERDIDNMENTQSHSMAVMYLQGSSSSQGGQAGSSSQSNFNYGISSVIVGTDKVTKEILYKGKSRPHELFQIPVVKLMHFPSQSFEYETLSSSTHDVATPQDHFSLLPVHNFVLIQVVLPFSSCSSSSENEVSNSDISRIVIQTRLQIGAITRKDYTAYLASLPKLQSLHIELESYCFSGYSLLAQVFDLDEPKNFRSASSNIHWQKAMQEEFDALKSQGTWDLVHSPSHRLAAQGFTQEHGIDYSETFSPVVRHSTVRLVLALATSSDTTQVQQVVDKLAELFELKDMGQLTYFLGLQIQYKDNGDLFVHQSKCIKDLIKKAGMEHCKATSTPSKPHTQLLFAEGTPLEDPTFYISIVGALQYLVFTCPNISYFVNIVCQYMQNPTETHIFLVKRIL